MAAKDECRAFLIDLNRFGIGLKLTAPDSSTTSNSISRSTALELRNEINAYLRSLPSSTATLLWSPKQGWSYATGGVCDSGYFSTEGAARADLESSGYHIHREQWE